jgi:enoyl-CoA hydratase/carnithine racemase
MRTMLARWGSDQENEGVPVTDPPLVSIADLADGGAGGGGGVASLDDIGRVQDPLVLVGLDGTAPPAAVARAADRVRADGRLFVGVAAEPLPETLRPLLTALDTTLVAAGTADAIQVYVPVPDVEGEAASLAAVVASGPQAAVVLGQVLRATETLPAAAALDVESFAYSMLLGGPEFRAWYDEQGERSLPGLVAEPVLVRRDGNRLMITLNRPERRNAYGRQLRDALADALRIALLDPGVERVVLAGAGPSFCAGGDLAEFGTTPDLTTAHFIRTQGGAGLLLSALKDRVEVHLHGPCVGAGVELPAFAGTVTAAAGTTFRLPEAGMGLIPGAGGTVSIPRRIGRWRTLYLALSGRPLDAETALGWGLVDAVRPA